MWENDIFRDDTQFLWEQPLSDKPSRSSFPSDGSSTDSPNAELKCKVCELAASGNNFGVATCESCKTFFRRNAKRDQSQIRCLHQGNCKVTKEYRRSCTSCRLAKCFGVGMKKELILSDEKLRQRARPTFKKPRYRWCRLPANIDIDKLLAMLPPEQRRQCQQQDQQDMKIKQEFTPDAYSGSSSGMQEWNAAAAGDSQQQQAEDFEAELVGSVDWFDPSPQQPTPSSFESSQIYNKLSMCVTNYQLPYEQQCAATLTSQLCSLEDGFSALENSVRKMIRVIPEMPFFEGIDKLLLARLLKYKVFGGIHIISSLSYDCDKDAWIVLLQNGRGMEEAVIHTREAVIGSFMSLAQRRSSEGRQLHSVRDVEKIYETLVGCYRDLRQLFGDQRNVASVILLAVYLLEEDTGLSLDEAERVTMRRLQQQYIQYLRSVIGLQQQQQSAVDCVCSKALLLLARIRWLDVRYSDSAKLLQFNLVPALIQELAGN